MPNQTSAADAARAILREAILHGAYRVGDLMPSSRDLADRFGINRNTANKIYRELAVEGLVETSANRPPTVVAREAIPVDRTLHQRIRAVLWPLLQEGRLRQLPEMEIRQVVGQVIQDFFDRDRAPRVLVCECNSQDAERYARELTSILGCTVRPILLDQLNSRSEADIVAAPLFHLAEVQSALGEQRDRAEGFLVTAVAEDVAHLIGRVSSGPVGLVAGNRLAAERLTNVLRFHLHTLHTPFLVATLDDRARVAYVVREAEAVACTARCWVSVDQAGGSTKAVTIRYRVEPVSVELLRARVFEWQRGPLNSEPLVARP